MTKNKKHKHPKIKKFCAKFHVFINPKLWTGIYMYDIYLFISHQILSKYHLYRQKVSFLWVWSLVATTRIGKKLDFARRVLKSWFITEIVRIWSAMFIYIQKTVLFFKTLYNKHKNTTIKKVRNTKYKLNFKQIYIKQ